MKISRKTQRKIKAIISPILTFPIYWFYKILTATLRYEEHGREIIDELHDKGERHVLCIWHDELFPFMKMKKHMKIVTVVSPSVDGNFLVSLLNKLDVQTVRGSSTRQGVNALLNAVKVMKNEHVHAVVTIDGPLGPRHEVKEGALFLAFHAKAHIVPTRLTMEKCYAFNTWDRFKVPYPFSKVKVEYYPPYLIEAENLTSEVLAEEKEKLQNRLEGMGNGKQ